MNATEKAVDDIKPRANCLNDKVILRDLWLLHHNGIKSWRKILHDYDVYEEDLLEAFKREGLDDPRTSDKPLAKRQAIIHTLEAVREEQAELMRKCHVGLLLSDCENCADERSTCPKKAVEILDTHIAKAKEAQ